MDMKNILTLRNTDIFPDDKKSELKDSDYNIRNAARAVIINDKGQIALMNVVNLGYHKIPGGGLEEGEDIIKALHREVMEEIGCKIEIIGEIGKTIEYHDKKRKLQTSFCYLARQIGDQQEPNFTQAEIEMGFSIIWAKDIDEAIEMIKNDKPYEHENTFVTKRELAILTEAKKILDSK